MQDGAALGEGMVEWVAAELTAAIALSSFDPRALRLTAKIPPTATKAIRLASNRMRVDRRRADGSPLF
jgi:hypothetical protein